MTAESILLTILMFFVLVGFHEFGHLYFAKRAGILVREFAIGFGPKVFSYKRGETRYTFRLFPLGGFVRMAGEDPEVIEIQQGQTIAVTVDNEGRVDRIYLDQLDTRKSALRAVVESIDLEHRLQLKLDVDGEMIDYAVHPEALLIGRGKETQIAPWNRQFGSKTVGQRSMAIFAGPLMNFVLSFLLFILFVFMTGVPMENPTHVELSHVQEGAAADQAGLQKGDIIVSINNEAIGIDRDKMIAMIQASAGETMQWIVERDGKQHQIDITPADTDGIGIVGVSITYPNRKPGPIEGIVQAGVTMGDAIEQNITVLKMLVTFQVKLDDLGGPIRATEMTGEAVSRGLNIYVFWAGFLSLYLGIFNLLPFPALDGSRLLFLGIEAVRGKPIDPQREGMVHFIGFAMLMLLMVVVAYNDILRLLKVD